ncbi:uncharacterized protein LOC129746663 isoform X2 [Uranotaenia lowii]|uniref:uncharacterized protein LOC129746663 isoform X2 n=1 Tax=Uranotaenia lowii TaxID=190385 RepID=UPI0024796BB1|nr:uncharacterized protein LOC129746663 isoform X2 [Uranotaenia lowii]
MATHTFVATIEPYRKGSSFTDWVERLGYFFVVNNILGENRKAHLITLSGQAVFTQLKLLFPNGKLESATYEEIVEKLKTRYDKVPSLRVQRYQFTHRVQQPGESLEDFLLSLKMQASFCNLSDNELMLDRMVGGIRNENLKIRLLNEPDLTVEKAENIILTWEMAANSMAMMAPAVSNNYAQVGAVRRPIKERLGYKPYNREHYKRHQAEDHNYSKSKGGFGSNKNKKKKPNYSTIICDFCGVKGHPVRKCFKMKNMRREAVNFVDPGNMNSCEKYLSELMQKVRTKDSDSETDSDSDMDWKRAGSRPSGSAEGAEGY